MDKQPAWDIRERAFDFACDVVKYSRKLAKETGCRHVADQLMDAATSVAANTEEAKSAFVAATYRPVRLG